jgi:hypothetical protein
VARIAAHDADHATTANDLALIANTPNAGTDFHGNTHSTEKLADDNRSTTTGRLADDAPTGPVPRLVENG